MSLENHDYGEQADAPKKKESGFLQRNLNRGLVLASLALGATPALAQDQPIPMTKSEKVQLQKEQFDKEMANNAHVLEALSKPPVLDTPLGSGFQPTLLNKQQLDKEIANNAGVLEALSKPPVLDTPLGSGFQPTLLNKQQLDKEIANNAGVLEALRKPAEDK